MFSADAVLIMHQRVQVMVKVTDTRSSYVWMWSSAKFVNRRYMMQELYEQQCVSGCAPQVDQAKVR